MIRLIYLAVPVICLWGSFFAKPKDEKAELTASEILALVDFDAGGKTYKQKGSLSCL